MQQLTGIDEKFFFKSTFFSPNELHLHNVFELGN